jgi:hypothetical protein
MHCLAGSDASSMMQFLCVHKFQVLCARRPNEVIRCAASQFLWGIGKFPNAGFEQARDVCD